MGNLISLMYSGGLDSHVAYYYAMIRSDLPKLLYVNLGHPYSRHELAAIEKLEMDVTILDLDLYDQIKYRLTNQIIPSRNVLFATIGAMFSPEVWICSLEGEQHGKEHDKSTRFYRDTSNLLSYTNEFFQPETVVTTPFGDMSKTQVIRWALDAGISAEELLLTRSCYSEAEPCGQCLTCVKRHMAFLLNGIDDGNQSKVVTSVYFAELLREIPRAVKEKRYDRFTKQRINEFYIYCDFAGVKS